eukprot:g3836.t1
MERKEMEDDYHIDVESAEPTLGPPPNKKPLQNPVEQQENDDYDDENDYSIDFEASQSVSEMRTKMPTMTAAATRPTIVEEKTISEDAKTVPSQKEVIHHLERQPETITPIDRTNRQEEETIARHDHLAKKISGGNESNSPYLGHEDFRAYKRALNRKVRAHAEERKRQQEEWTAKIDKERKRRMISRRNKMEAKRRELDKAISFVKREQKEKEDKRKINVRLAKLQRNREIHRAKLDGLESRFLPKDAQKEREKRLRKEYEQRQKQRRAHFEADDRVDVYAERRAILEMERERKLELVMKRKAEEKRSVKRIRKKQRELLLKKKALVYEEKLISTRIAEEKMTADREMKEAKQRLVAKKHKLEQQRIAKLHKNSPIKELEERRKLQMRIEAAERKERERIRQQQRQRKQLLEEEDHDFRLRGDAYSKRLRAERLRVFEEKKQRRRSKKKKGKKKRKKKVELESLELSPANVNATNHLLDIFPMENTETEVEEQLDFFQQEEEAHEKDHFDHRDVESKDSKAVFLDEDNVIHVEKSPTESTPEEEGEKSALVAEELKKLNIPSALVFRRGAQKIAEIMKMEVLSRHEIREASLLFNELDENRQGKLRKDQLADIFQIITKNSLGSEKIDRLFKEGDANKSGAIEFDDFLQLIVKLRRGDLRIQGGQELLLILTQGFISADLEEQAEERRRQTKEEKRNLVTVQQQNEAIGPSKPNHRRKGEKQHLKKSRNLSKERGTKHRRDRKSGNRSKKKPYSKIDSKNLLHSKSAGKATTTTSRLLKKRHRGLSKSKSDTAVTRQPPREKKRIYHKNGKATKSLSNRAKTTKRKRVPQTKTLPPLVSEKMK